MILVGIVGLGEFGAALALELTRLKADVVGVDAERSKVERLSRQIGGLRVADGTDESALREAGFADADCACVTMAEGSEAAALAVLALRALGVSPIYARARDSARTLILKELGATEVLRLEQEAGRTLAARLAQPRVLWRRSLGGGNVLAEVVVDSGFLSGVPFGELDLARRFRLGLVGLRRQEPSTERGQNVLREAFVEKPDARLKLNVGDVLVVHGPSSGLDEFIQEGAE